MTTSEFDIEMRGQLTTAEDAVRFMTAGKSIVTLVSRKTGTRFSYRIVLSDDGKSHFVGLLSGPDNGADYRYLGRIADGRFYQGRKTPRPGDIGRDAPAMKAFAWTWWTVAGHGKLPDALEIWHEGRCGRCGRRLTVPASIASGFGPECSKNLMCEGV